jgi:hypothetical protein
MSDDNRGVVIGSPESFGWMDTGDVAFDGEVIWERPNGKRMKMPAGEDIYVRYDPRDERPWQWIKLDALAQKPRPRPKKKSRPMRAWHLFMAMLQMNERRLSERNKPQQGRPEGEEG